MFPRRRFQVMFAVLLVAATVSISQPARGATCSNAILNGVYGALTTGYDSSGLYLHTLTQIKSNGKGTFTGTETASDDGTIFNKVPVTGTYTINSNCTGSGTITPKGAKTSHFNLVVDPISNLVDSVGTDSGHGTASGQGTPLGTASCSVGALNANFGFHGGGDIPAQGVWQLAGQFSFSGAGKLSGTETSVVAGTVTSAAITGTYTMATSCMGTLTYKVNTTTRHWNIVMVSGGQGFLGIDTDSGFVGTLTAHE